ncbi:surface polysaccharide O-acyltransferase-like enzyme [Ruminiclostridium sufflavum DSM 19573]|uniref:Surface polysaccharide O-acyltransferase-like enzyme n=1 Tax=Ruminiclostridium sufflavum DSM 19573 TaxID=1121337 RepID=A0A318XJP6_9FIRM|nr:acyltransferase family protein [Ruminiclostridium sufflavum]PYG87224.1 surface polysaccharide O-acyltransferase-like enzyme [Ruminiclostridium sufflavum DSM 19573]
MENSMALSESIKETARQENREYVSKPLSSNRLVYVDMLKLLAIIGVITIHICAVPLTTLKIASSNWEFALLFGAAVRWAVPVFLMCSGALFLKTDKVIAAKRIFTKYLSRILCALFVWASFYEGLDIYRAFRSMGYFDYTLIYKAIEHIFTFNTQTHLYYLYIVILIYSLLPALRVFTDNASKRQMEYLLIAWVILGIVLPFAVQFRPFSLIRGMVRQYPMSMVYSAIGYFMAGHYLNKYPLKKRTNYIFYFLGITGLLVTICGTELSSISRNAVYTSFLEGMTPNVAAMAAALFLLIKNHFERINRQKQEEAASGRLRRIIVYISKGSFCIYLVHVAFIDLLKDLSLTFPDANTLITIPVLVTTVFMLSLGVYFILSRIPGINKYLI